MLSYNTRLIPQDPKDMRLIKEVMEQYRQIVNEASGVQFADMDALNSHPRLHKEFYHPARERHPDMPSQMVIKAEMECVASYRSMKSNKHKIDKPFEKKNLSLRLDKRLFSKDKDDPYAIKITTKEKRKKFSIHLYPKLKWLLDNYSYQVPLIFFKDNGLWISFPFEVEQKPLNQTLALGVDLGIRRAAACSDGRIIIDKKFNKEKRRLRYLKRVLQSKGTKSSRKHLKKLKRKERNKNKNQTHLISNIILQTNANVIALENLQGIKAKKYKRQNKNAISQVPLHRLREVLEYKAKNMGKHVRLVSPAYTSQIDSITGLKEGERKGCRFYAKSGLVYDADINAAINIARRSKLPISLGNQLDGQGIVNCPNACQSAGRKTQECCKPTVLSVGG